MTLVVDASFVVSACLNAGRFAALSDSDLVAPPLLWPEVRSALHELVWRRELVPQDGLRALTALDAADVRVIAPAQLGQEAWRLADAFGWAKTYDAEYVALAQLLECRLVTLDARLRRGADRLGFVVSPSEV